MSKGLRVFFFFLIIIIIYKKTQKIILLFLFLGKLILFFKPFNYNGQIIHGLVVRIMQVIGLVPPDDNTTYYLKPSEVRVHLSPAYWCFFLLLLLGDELLSWFLLKEPEFLLGTQASIIYKGKQIGTSGIVHPEVIIILYDLVF